MIAFWQSKELLKNQVYIPKYYDPSISNDLAGLQNTHNLNAVSELIDRGWLSVSTGDEIGKMAYGTGDIPFVRTSDISNWEIKSAPKQGVSRDIYLQYAKKQDVRPGDILLVRDGTYLIGTNCFVSSLDKELVYQSHLLKFRLTDSSGIDPYLLFLALNSDIVQRQIRSYQFTADTIDTIGNRYLDLVLPIPKDEDVNKKLIESAKAALTKRIQGKAFVKQTPFLLETALLSGNANALADFLKADLSEIESEIRQDTVTAEFGNFETFWLRQNQVKDSILLPKYYDPEVSDELVELSKNCDCRKISDLIDEDILELSTGDEIGKMAYGTGSIPFLRTSDFSNWEIKHDPKQGISEAIYAEYATKQDVREQDILLVRDGTYLVGNSCIITSSDKKALYCGGLYKIRSKNHEKLSPFLLLGLLNSYIVKRQIRTKQFTRDVIDTIGQRLKEVVIPIPKSDALRSEISKAIENAVNDRMTSRQLITELSLLIEKGEGPKHS